MASREIKTGKLIGDKWDLSDKVSGFLSGDETTIISYPPTIKGVPSVLDPIFTLKTKLGFNGNASYEEQNDASDSIPNMSSSLSLDKITANIGLDEIYPLTNKGLDGDWKFFPYKPIDGGDEKNIMKINFTFLGIDLIAELTPEVRLDFDANSIMVDLKSTDGLINEEKPLGSSFGIVAPANLNSIDLVSNYSLNGSLTAKFGLGVKLSFDLKALGLDLNIGTLNHPNILLRNFINDKVATEFTDDYLVNKLNLPAFLKDNDQNPEKYLFDWQEEFDVNDFLKNIMDTDDLYIDTFTYNTPVSIEAIGSTYHVDIT